MQIHLRFYLLAGLLALLSIFGPLAAGAAYPPRPAESAPVGHGGAHLAPGGQASLVPTTHGRLSQIYWRRTTGGFAAEIHALAGMRRSFFTPPPNVGDTVPVTAIVFGDGQQSPTADFTVTFVDLARDWFIAEKTETHIYNGPGPWVAFIAACCRLNGPQHINNPDQDFKAETLIDFARTGASPITSLPAIVDCPREGFCSFTVPASDPDNQPLRFRLATTAEAGDTDFVHPGPPHAPHPIQIDRLSGLVIWDTHGATINTGAGDTFYSTQVIIEDLDFNGSIAGKSAMDFLIRLIPQTGNQPPQFIAPTPPDNTLFYVLPGQPLNVPIRAMDPDQGDTVTLAVLNLPPGAGFPIPPPANPVSSTLTWTPSLAQLGAYVVNFTATDPQNTSALTSLRINVVLSVPTDTPTPTNTPPPTPTGTPTHTFTPTVSPTPCTIQFTDVDLNNPFYTYIRCLACRNIISGYADGTFRWQNDVTRAQVSKMVANAAGFQDGINSTQQTFVDVPASAPFWIFVERLARRGLINGYDCGAPGEPCDPQNRPYFRPNNSVTRGQLAKIDAGAVGYADPIPSGQQTFADVPPGSAFWRWVELVALHGVISGYACGGPGEPCDPALRPYFRAYSPATRGQTSKIVANTFFPGCITPARR